MSGIKDQLKISLKTTSFKLLKCFFIPTWKRTILIAIVLSLYIGFHIYILKTNFLKKEFWKVFLENLQTFEISILAFLFTGYAIFQTSLKESAIEKLLKPNKDGHLYLIVINKYFYFITLMYLILILFNIVLISIIKTNCLNIMVNLFPCLRENIFQLILLLPYLVINLILLFDIKSFLKNIHDIFVINVY